MNSIRAERCFDGVSLRGRTTVHFDEGRIVELTSGDAPAAIELPPGAILSPGFIDLQVNGGGGAMFNDHPDAAGLARIADAHARCGTTTIFPTLISGPRDLIAMSIEAAARPLPGIGGLHIEGPFIAKSRRGIHPERHIISLTDADVAVLSKNIGIPLIVTLAPETVALGAIRRLTASRAIVSIGHSDATYAEAEAAIEAGASSFTHLFNATSQLAPREPGVIGAALASRDAFAGIIVDGLHVHPATVRIAYAAMGASRLFLVSDAMATAGSNLTEFDLYGTRITLRDGKLSSAAGTLAGAHLTMAEAIRNAVRLVGIPLTDALKMATSTPAAFAKLLDRGGLAPGLRADFTAIDENFGVLGVWRDGAGIPAPS